MEAEAFRRETSASVLRSRYTALGEWEDGRSTVGRIETDPTDAEYRILRTGDLVRLRSDGLLQVAGRCDRQIKISGYRVEPAEIETVVRRVAGVADVAIVAQRAGDDTTLVAAVVGDPQDISIVERVRSATRSCLPKYMQPARILLAEKLPRLPGGKIDAEAVLRLDASRFEANARLIGELMRSYPASERARQLVARAWVRTLGRTSLEAESTFEEAGGDSLKLLALIFRIEEQLGTTVPLDLIDEHLRPSEFAVALDQWLNRTTIAHDDDVPPL